MSQVILPDQTVEKLQRHAIQQGIDPAQLIVQLVEDYLANQSMTFPPTTSSDLIDQDDKIEQEQRCFEAQHIYLLSVYNGQHIAMHQGKVVDHDADRVALRRRIRASFGKTPVLITPVTDEPRQIIHIRSPKLVEHHQ